MADDASATLYDTDFYLWTQAQAAALRARAGSDKTLDYDRLAEEIEDLGKSDYRAVTSAVRLILEHLYKLHATRRREPVGHWKREIVNFRDSAARAATPSIRRMIAGELEPLHAKGADMAALDFESYEPDAAIDPARRWTWDEIMGEANDPLDQAFPLAGDR